ncbi:hypothetical protein GCM10018781_37420 [Kitasatospora indigofera]|uniref:Uncharacterized protein n=1 Tax=Kitasatospora indigofera TaxID=67307 RepID=A0A919KUQ8_9ACTN|nr:hypothetical protein GCM10018781_37420 [Kitasatospora indigofera]
MGGPTGGHQGPGRGSAVPRPSVRRGDPRAVRVPAPVPLPDIVPAPVPLPDIVRAPVPLPVPVPVPDRFPVLGPGHGGQAGGQLGGEQRRRLGQ